MIVYKCIKSIQNWYTSLTAKELQYLIAIFMFFLSFIGPLYKLKVKGHGGRGNYLPTEPLSWAEIYDKVPEYLLFALGFSIFFFYFMGYIIKDSARIEKIDKQRNNDKLFSDPNTHECRVCGLYLEHYPWGEDGRSPSLDLCPCCGVQFGVDDDTIDIIKAYRAKWLNEGAKWFQKKLKPEQWHLDKQLSNIPDKFK